MKKLLFNLSFLALIFISCEKDTLIINNDQLIIEMGSICGWCVPGDTLVLDNINTNYSITYPCEESTVEKEEKTNSSDWNELVGLLDKDEFSKIDINTCYYCADGCDIWIKIIDENYSHMIRFGYEDSTTLETIKPFVDKLDSIRLDFRE